MSATGAVDVSVSGSASGSGGTIVVCDVDGTLTKPRNVATPEMTAFLAQVRTHAKVAIVGGSDFTKIQEQMGKDSQPQAPSPSSSTVTPPPQSRSAPQISGVAYTILDENHHVVHSGSLGQVPPNSIPMIESAIGTTPIEASAEVPLPENGGDLDMDALSSVINLVSTAAAGDPVSSTVGQCFSVMKELLLFVPEVATELRKDYELLQLLFNVMPCNLMFTGCVSLAEELLAVKPGTVSLSDMGSIMTMMSNFDVRELSFFCKVLTHVLFDPDRLKPSSADELIEQTELLDFKKSMTIDKNHALVLGVPGLLHKFVRLLKAQHVFVTMQDQSMVLLEIMFLILGTKGKNYFNWDQLESFSRKENTGNNDASHPGTIGEDDAFNAIGALGTLMNFGPDNNGFISDNLYKYLRPAYLFTLASCQVELLFVFSSLLTGRRRCEVQHQLALMEFIPALSAFFDRIPWDVNCSPSMAEHGPHGEDCECNPDTTLKVQYLRVIIVWCERDNPWRNLLMSDHELLGLDNGRTLSEMKRQVPLGICYSSQGLMSKIIKTLYTLPSDSLYKFWMTSCIEAFARNTCPYIQSWVAKSGVLQFIVNELSTEGTQWHPNVLQTDFDLLGEIIKFNLETLLELDKILMATKFDIFYRAVVNHLVDSNVFVRSVFLTLGNPFLIPDFTESNRELHDRCLGSRLYTSLKGDHNIILQGLMAALTFKDITQENICCLNTTVLFFVFLNERHQVEPFLEEIALETKAKCTLFRNFSNLLYFWNSYYTSRAWERHSISLSSRIPFTQWANTHAVVSEAVSKFLHE
ncbi:Short transient receptor potential channel 4-associated protein [Pelomyxa schiedti]|nr:Short transient receptor potential channel 4-associated protein [Pelomyxa schiedti]